MNYDNRDLIDHIEFTILGNEEIKSISSFGKKSIGVDVPDLYDNLEQKKNGLIDTRMGTTEFGVPCGTCELDSSHCEGHFGHITLEEPVFHIGYLNTVKKVLGCICLKCSKLLIYKNEEEIENIVRNKSRKARLSEIRNVVKDVTHCQKLNSGCGAPTAKIRIDPTKKGSLSINLIAEYKLEQGDKSEATEKLKKKTVVILTPEICYNILKNISDHDCELMGFNPEKCRPEMMIHKIFPVPPVPVRPTAKTDGSTLAREDGLTGKLADIVKKNINLSKVKDSTSENSQRARTENAQLLQYCVAIYYDNESPLFPKSDQKGKTTKPLAARLKGKEGRIRNNLMGKRVDFSARTVITPDPSLDINQVGVPLSVAMELTHPEIVTPENLDHMTKLVRNGKFNYPGANFVIPKIQANSEHTSTIDLRFRKNVEIHVGDIVERHLVNGDIVLLNRQPTLHKQSMMGHYAVIVPNEMLSSFRVNVGVTEPYNADFDGR